MYRLLPGLALVGLNGSLCFTVGLRFMVNGLRFMVFGLWFALLYALLYGSLCFQCTKRLREMAWKEIRLHGHHSRNIYLSFIGFYIIIISTNQ